MVSVFTSLPHVYETAVYCRDCDGTPSWNWKRKSRSWDPFITVRRRKSPGRRFRYGELMVIKMSKIDVRHRTDPKSVTQKVADEETVIRLAAR